MRAGFVPPMAAELVDRLPEGDDWMYEVKLDGSRALVIKNGDQVQLRSRDDKDLTVATERCPFVALPNAKPSRWGGVVTAELMREMRWLKPRLVAQVHFVEWTSDSHLRHASFLGLRTDKIARDIRRNG